MPVEVELCCLLCFCDSFYLVNVIVLWDSALSASPQCSSLSPLWVHLALVLPVIMCSFMLSYKSTCPRRLWVLEGGTHIYVYSFHFCYSRGQYSIWKSKNSVIEVNKFKCSGSAARSYWMSFPFLQSSFLIIFYNFNWTVECRGIFPTMCLLLSPARCYFLQNKVKIIVLLEMH